MEQVTYISDNGLFITFGDMPPYLLESIDAMGVGSIEDEGMTAGGGYATYLSDYSRRTVPMEVSVWGGERNGWYDLANLQTLRQRMAAVLDLRYQGTLVYENDTGAYQLRGRFLEIPAGSGLLGSGERFSLSFQSTESPKWRERDERVSQMGAVRGGISFPLVIDPKFSFGTYTTEFTIINDTYDALPVRVVVMGTAESVTVANETSGQFMKFNRPISDGQQLEIDTGRGTAVVRSAMTGAFVENASHYLTLDSDYWYLQRGRNVIHLDGGGQTSRPLGYLFWSKQFGGV